jgi:hypothetical protein
MTGHANLKQRAKNQDITPDLFACNNAGRPGYLSIWAAMSEGVEGVLEAPCHAPVVGEVPL